MEYTSCFIGIPVPSSLNGQFVELQNLAKQIFSEIRLADQTTPHITLYYLDRQSANKLEEVKEVVEKEKQTLNAEAITGINIDYFGNKPRVLFIKIKLTSKLSLIHDKFTNDLLKFRANDEFNEFTPHITIGKFPKDKEIVDFSIKIKEINNKYIDFQFKFPIAEIDIYGVDSNIQPEKQEKLIKVTL